ncbi:DUF559 domain-containing protein [Microbacterium sp. BWT-B31]|uniref:endonuclease domain-containing protein n=1 Tax=Microbacterium sp. BWT-B31 TaxID=3232072 RepID=UPI003528D899
MARLTDLLAWLDRQGGIAHSADARAAGFTAHDMRAAVESRAVRRIRRSWLHTRAAPDEAIGAVNAGGRLTCLSDARLRGLWVPAHEELHVAVAGTSSEPVRAGVRFHRARAPMPVARHAWRDPVVNSLARVAECVPREDALAVWESAIRKGHASAAQLVRVAWAGPRARSLAEAAGELSDSGLETIVADRLRPFGVPLRQQVRLEGHPVDLLLGDRLVVQLDGFEHHREAKDRRRDIAHDVRLRLLGYTVLRFDYAQIMFGWDEVERSILMSVAQDLHR